MSADGPRDCRCPPSRRRRGARGEPRLRVVPVVEVPPIPLQRFHAAQRICRAYDELSGRQITEVVSRQIGKQRQSHVGRRSTVRDGDRRMFLHVVGRQKMVVRSDVRLEIGPRLPRELAQEVGLVNRQPRRSVVRADG